MSDDESSGRPRRRQRRRGAGDAAAGDEPASAPAAQQAQPAAAAGAAGSDDAPFQARLIQAQADSDNWKNAGGNYMWIPDEEKAFVVGEVTERRGEEVEVQLEDGTRKTVKIADIHPMNPPKLDKISDMARLSHLNEPAVLHNLRQRYEDDKIYTYSGLFLAAINPYKRLPIYTNEVVQSYAGRRREDVEPHVFAVADNAYRNMLSSKINQSMLITGESGAGKTENTKKVIQYLTSVAHSTGTSGKLEQQLLRTNPLLEAFGNAKTIRNNNSSRFGKFIEIAFNASGYIIGTKISNYLLETTRVTSQNPDERNYHFFYQICSDAEAKAKYQLDDVMDYTYLNQSGCTVVSEIDDKREFKDTIQAMEIIGLDREEIESVCSTSAAILHLGNIEFGADNKGLATVKQGKALTVASDLLGVDAAVLSKGFTHPNIVTPNEVIQTHVTPDQASANRNALVRSTYGRLFSWLVKRINQSLASKETVKNFIGVLDIAGFEIFQQNSFEQLCINYTNERLQQFFNHHMFKREQEEYLKEQIEWKYIDFGLDLQPTIDLIEKPLGIFAILDQQNFMPGGSDEGLIREIHKNHKDKTIFKLSKFDPMSFTLSHYAGEVTYSTKNWLSKNVDPLNDDCKKAMLASKFKLVRTLFELTAEEKEALQSSRGQRGSKFATVATSYKNQLKSLMTVLESTEPHFIRCIVPNNLKRPGVIDPHLVLHQLRCNGVLEGIRISRKGYPGRISFEEFVKRYELLATKTDLLQEVTVKGKARAILKNTGFQDTKHYKIGLTKIFLRAGVEASIEELREAKLSQIIVNVQAAIRGFHGRQKYEQLKGRVEAISVIQRNWRAYSQLKDWAWWSLFQKARPLISTFKQEQEEKKRKQEQEALKAKLEAEEAAKKALEVEKDALNREITRFKAEQEATARMQEENSRNIDLMRRKMGDLEDVIDKLQKDKRDLEESKLKLANVIEDRDEKLAAKMRELDDAMDSLKSQGKDVEFGRKAMQDRDQAIAKLETRLKHLEAELKDTKGKYEDEQTRNADHERVRRSLDDKLKELSFQLEQVAKARADADARGKKLESDLKQSQKEGKDLRGEVDRLISEVSTFKVNLDKKDEDLKQRVRDLEDAEREKKKTDAALRELNDQLAEEGRKRSQLETKLRHTKGDQTELANQLEILTETNGRLDEQLNKTRDEVNAVRAQLNEVEALKMSLESEKTSLEKSSKQLEDRLRDELNRSQQENQRNVKKYDDMIRELQDQIADLQAQKANLEKKLKKAEKDFKDLKTQFDQLVAEKEETEKKVMKVELDLADLRNSLDLEKKRNTDLENERKALQNEVKDLRSTLDNEKESLGRSDGKSKKLQMQLDEEKERVSQLEGEKEVVERAKADVERQLKDAKSELDKTRAEGLSLKTQIDQLQKESKDTLERLQDSDSNKSRSESSVRQLTEQVQELSLALENERNAKGSLEKKRKQLEQDLKKAAQQLEEEQRRLREEQSKRESLETQLRQSEMEKIAKISEASELSRRAKTLESQVTDLQVQLADAQNDASKARAEARDLKAKVVELENALEDAQSSANNSGQVQKEVAEKVAEFQRKLDGEKARAAALEQENNRIKVDLEQATQESRQEQRKAQQQAQQFKQQLQENEEQQQRQLRALNEEKADLKQEIKQLQRDLSRAPQQAGGAVDVEAMDKLRRDFDIQLARMAAELNDEKSVRVDAENRRRELEISLDEIKDALDREQRQRKKLETEAKSLFAELEGVREIAEEADEMRDELSLMKKDSESYIQSIKDELTQERLKSAQVEETLNKLRRDNQQLKADLESERAGAGNEARRIKGNLESELSDIENLLLQTKREKNLHAKELKAMSMELLALQRQLEVESREKVDLTVVVGQRDRELKKLRTDLEFIGRNSQKYETENARMSSELTNYKQRVDELEVALEKLRAQSATAGVGLLSGKTSRYSSGLSASRYTSSYAATSPRSPYGRFGGDM